MEHVIPVIPVFDTAVLKSLYYIVIECIGKANSIDQPYGYTMDDFEETFEDCPDDKDEYCVFQVFDQSLRIKKPLRTLDDQITLKIDKFKSGGADFNLFVNVELVGMGEVFGDDEVNGLASIINYGTEKLKSMIREKILSSSNVLVNRRWVYSIKDVGLYVSKRIEYNVEAACVVVSLMFQVTEESH